MLLVVVLSVLSTYAADPSNGMKPMVVGPAGTQSGGPAAGQPVPAQPTIPAIVPRLPGSKGGGAKPPSGSANGGQSGNPQIQDLIKNYGGDTGVYHNGDTGVGGQHFGPGIMEKCDQATANAQQRFEEAKTFREACGLAQKGNSQKIVVNDYSVLPGMMFIFDLQGKCLGKTMAAFGNGAGGDQVGCSDANSHLTPPGLHLTCVHHGGGGKFTPENSLKLCGLQGQGSVGRGVLIHGTRAPGTSSTWGCTGVDYGAFGAVQKTLGYGALVYNYFAPHRLARGCRSNAGMSVNNPRCQLDSGSPEIPNATEQGAPATVWWQSLLLSEAYATKPVIPEREYLKKGTEVTIFRYLPQSDTYEVQMVREEAVGPNVATPEALKKALEMEGSIEAFKKNLARDVGTNYVLKKDLPLLWGREIYKRQQKRK